MVWAEWLVFGNEIRCRQNSETADSLLLWQVSSLYRTSEKQGISVLGYGASMVGMCLEVLVITDNEDAGILITLSIIQF